MTLQVLNTPLSPALAEVPFRPDVVHQSVTAYLSGARQGTVQQKNRSDVSGGGRKPWRQKGTGRARAGSTRSPIWRGGGTTFAARPRSYQQKVNRKVYQFALKSLIAELARRELLTVVEKFEMDVISTATMSKNLKTLGIKGLWCW